jgi:SAM-dependent methyltransferase
LLKIIAVVSNQCKTSGHLPLMLKVAGMISRTSPRAPPVAFLARMVATAQEATPKYRMMGQSSDNNKEAYNKAQEAMGSYVPKNNPHFNLGAPPSFDGAQRAKTFKNLFEIGWPMWTKMDELGRKHQPTARKLLDLGWFGCSIHEKFELVGCSTDLFNLANGPIQPPNMEELAKQRVAARGLDYFEVCNGMVLDISDLGPVADASCDMVTGHMSYQFVPDKPKALRETLRVMKPGGILVATVWEAFDQVTMAAEIMKAVTGQPATPSSPNPCGPLGLADPAVFDKLLTEAGFELTGDHNYSETQSFQLGPDSGTLGMTPAFKLNTFRVAALPIWDALTELEASGKEPQAWEKAQAAFLKISKPFVDDSGIVLSKGTFRIAVAKKPL